MANKPVQHKPETLQDIKKRIEAEEKRNPEAFKKKYSKKAPRVQ